MISWNKEAVWTQATDLLSGQTRINGTRHRSFPLHVPVTEHCVGSLLMPKVGIGVAGTIVGINIIEFFKQRSLGCCRRLEVVHLGGISQQDDIASPRDAADMDGVLARVEVVAIASGRTPG